MRRFAALLLVFIMLLTPQALAFGKEGTDDGALVYDKNVTNILLIGSDARDVDENARSDVMLLISLNKNTKQIIMTSFMRDIYTEIPGHEDNRLNAAYAFGGAELLVETLEADFGVRIDNYAAVNFYVFADVVDTMGGIDLELSNSEVDFINGQAYYGEQAQMGVGTGSIYLDYSADGWYHLNGTQTLAHCRNRSSAGSDFDRTERQRSVLSAALGQIKDLSLRQLFALGKLVISMVRTDVTVGQGISLFLSSGRFGNYQVVTQHIPEDGEYSGVMIDGMAVLVVDFDAASRRMQENIYG